MQPVRRSEVLHLGEYETVRPHFRARVIEEKKRRRVAVGPDATALFENHDTVLLQIQEMLRTERISREAAIAHEIATYNELVPGENELSATLMFEIDDKDRRDTFLVDAKGIEGHVALVVQDPSAIPGSPLAGDGARFAATWNPERVLEDRASAVLYLKFPMSPEAAEAVRSRRAKVSVVVDHPAYRVKAPIGDATLASLAEDLESEPS